MARLATRQVEWASASRPLTPGAESGDMCYARAFRGGFVVAAVDGLGHGREAAVVAQLTLTLVAGAEAEHPLAVILRCHEGLKATRGAVLSLARFDDEAATMTWVGVGSVQGVLLRATLGAIPRRETLLLGHGVLGRRLPRLHASTLQVAPGDTLVFATDGIAPAFADPLTLVDSPPHAAERILAAHATGGDDALVIVARYCGGGA